jgi:hypothetical protein
LKKIKGTIIVLLVVIFAGCEKDEPLLPENETSTELNQHDFGFDFDNKIIIYNGKSIAINNGKLIIGDDVFNIETTDKELSIGKEYAVTFKGQVFRMFYTELPIVSITTNGAEIVDDPKVKGKIYLLVKGGKNLSNFIGIELRGGFFQTCPKKSYSIELWKDENGNDKEKKSLLGMRDDDDWILDGLWNEPIRIRDFTSHALWLEMGRVQHQNEDMTIGIDRKYCELFLNGKYQGVYYLGEKIDRKQLNLEKYNTQMEGELYKGYIWANGTVYSSVDDFDNNSLTWSGYEAKYPKEIGKVDWSNLHGLVDFIVNSIQSNFNNEISSKIDLDNVIDNYIFLNLIYATDNTGKNLFTGRYNSLSLYFFVPWDMDGSFGNDWKGERTNITNKLLSNGLYDKLLDFPDFRGGVKERWDELRNSKLNTAYLKKKFRDNYEYLDRNRIYDREALVPDITQNYSDTEIDFIESWIERRVIFLDLYFNSL